MLMTDAKWILYPGINLHSRLRYQEISRDFLGGDTLDAGCGNGMLSYKAYRNGSSVLGVSIKQREVDGCRVLFNEYHGIAEDRLRFEIQNLYDMRVEPESFDEIICTEVLEHIVDDSRICERFFEWLRPGGALHICAPNADHPYNAAFPLDEDEAGGHVRTGYTFKSYRELLEPHGFQIDIERGLGGPIRQAFNWRIKEIQNRFGASAGLPLFVLAQICLPAERLLGKPKVPYSLYVRARKIG